MKSSKEQLDELIARESAWLDLTMLRFVCHPALLQVFPEYLIGIYHSMRAAGALMESARLRSIALAPECPVADRLVEYWTRHIEEEAGHDHWLLEDLPAVGINCRSDLADPPLPEVAELLGTLHFWVLHTHPVAALPFFYIVERSPASVQQLDWMVKSAGIPREALRTFYRHAAIDVDHGRELEEFLDSLPLTEAHQKLLAVSATTVLRQLARIMERHVRRADDVLAAGVLPTSRVNPVMMTAISIQESNWATRDAKTGRLPADSPVDT